MTAKATGTNVLTCLPKHGTINTHWAGSVWIDGWCIIIINKMGSYNCTTERWEQDTAIKMESLVDNSPLLCISWIKRMVLGVFIDQVSGDGVTEK
jgi:hypothetical protein